MKKNKKTKVINKHNFFLFPYLYHNIYYSSVRTIISNKKGVIYEYYYG